MIKAFWKYRRQAVNEYKIHSPFVFEFYTEVVKKVGEVKDIDIRFLRTQLLIDNRHIVVTDLGAGSKSGRSNNRKISELARVQAISGKYGRLLSRITEYYKLGHCLELGTSLGIGTAYLAQSAEEVITIEGCPNIAEKAKENLVDLGLNNTEILIGDFEDKLPDALNEIEKLDLVYLDGNHQYRSTMKYFEQLFEKAHDQTFIILDDINWSEGMRDAWDEICEREDIHLSMEFFRMGIVMKRPGQVKQHFVLKF